MRPLSHLVVLPMLAIAIAVAGCGGGDDDGDAAAGSQPSDAQPTTPPRTDDDDRVFGVGGRETALELGQDFRTTLEEAGVELGAAGPARLEDGTLLLPVGEGRIDARDARGAVSHAGGIVLEARERDRAVTLAQPYLDTEDGTLHADVDGARVPLFDLDGGDAEIRREGDRLVAGGFDASLTERGAETLNERLGTDFEPGTDVGTLRLRLSPRLPDVPERRDDLSQSDRDRLDRAEDALGDALEAF